MSVFAHWPEVQDDVYATILWAADRQGVPRALMLAVAGFESGFNPWARGDQCAAVGLCDWGGHDQEGYCSFGLFQFNRCGGAGANHPIESLLDATYNAELAAYTMRYRYDATGSWYEALQPWSVRPNAWTVYQQQVGGIAEPAPGVGLPWLPALGLLGAALVTLALLQRAARGEPVEP